MRSRSRCSPIAHAFRDADPERARDALRRGLVIAQNSGNRGDESRIAGSLWHVEARQRSARRVEYLAVAIRNYHDAGNSTDLRPTLSLSPPSSTDWDTTSRRPPSRGSR